MADTHTEATHKAISTAVDKAQSDLEAARKHRDDLQTQIDEADATVEYLTGTLKDLQRLEQSDIAGNGKATKKPAAAKSTKSKSTKSKTSKPKASGKKKRGRKKGQKPRTKAIEEVLAEAGKPLTSEEVTEQLHAAGRNDDRDSVTASLSYLGSNDRAVHDSDNNTWTSPGTSGTSDT